MLSNRVVMAGKVEATEGVAEVLTAAEAFLVANPVFTPKPENTDRTLVSSSLSQFASIPGSRSATLGFDVELKGSGVTGTPPEWGELMKACGCDEVIVAGTSVTYAPASDQIPSITLAMYMDGIVKKAWGGRGDVSWKLEAGKPAALSFLFTLADFSVADAALLTGMAYDATIPPAFLGATFTVDAYAAIVQSLQFKMGNTVTLRKDINASSGYQSARISTIRKGALSIDPEMVTVATYDFFGKMRSGAEGALTAVLGATPGNIVTITAPKVQYHDLAEANRGGIATLGINCQLNRNAGDDEWSIALT